MKSKSWEEKMVTTSSQRKMTDKGMMYISTPKEIEEVIRTVPKGKLITTEIIARD